MTWRPLGFTFLGVDFNFRKVSKKLDPVAVSQNGAEIFPTYYCRLNEAGTRWECYPTVADAFAPGKPNVTLFDAAPPGAQFL